MSYLMFLKDDNKFLDGIDALIHKRRAELDESRLDRQYLVHEHT